MGYTSVYVRKKSQDGLLGLNRCNMFSLLRRMMLSISDVYSQGLDSLGTIKN